MGSGAGSDLRGRVNSVCGVPHGLFAEWIAFAVPAILLTLFVASPAKARVHASIVVDAATGHVLEAHHADRLAYPASLTKLMTLYLVFRALDRGVLSMRQRLHVSRHAAAQAPVKLWLRPGGFITVKSAILAITTRSANDAAVVLAEALGHTEWRFARLMTRTARRLGMTRTTFRNASGLPNRHQETTARDMATLARALIHKFPQYYHFFSVRSFVFHGKRIYGHDHLLGRYRGADGLKTGYIRASGYNLVTSAMRGGRRLVGVVLGGVTVRGRDQRMMALLTDCFSAKPSTVLAARSKAEPAVERHHKSYRLVAAAARVDAGAPLSRSWIVQIGHDFSSKRRVRRALQSARRTAPLRLRHARGLVVKLRGKHYRARFSQLTQRDALGTCRALGRKKFTCTAFEALPSRVMVASTAK